MLAADDCRCGLRAEEAKLSGEFGDSSQSASSQQVLDDIAFVKKSFVDDVRYTQTWGRIAVHSFRAVDYIPYVGTLGLGRDFVDWQIGEMDSELARWTRYGLEDLEKKGKLNGATPQQVAELLLGSSGPFRGEPQVVREEVSNFVVRQHAKDLAALRQQVVKLAAGLNSSKQLTGSQLRALSERTRLLEKQQGELEREISGIERQL